MPRHKFFGTKAPQKPAGLIIPETAVFLKNDCKEGKWMLGETGYGDEMECFIIKLSRRIAEYQDSRIAQAQLWLTPFSGKMPAGIVYYTLIKNSKSGRSGSLKNFGQQVAIAQSQGYDPRELVWMPKFVKRSGVISDENGMPQSASWYVLDWAFREPETAEMPTLDRCVAILESDAQLNALFDMDLEASSICVDGMSNADIRLLLQGNRPVPIVPETNGKQPALSAAK